MRQQVSAKRRITDWLDEMRLIIWTEDGRGYLFVARSNNQYGRRRKKSRRQVHGTANISSRQTERHDWQRAAIPPHLDRHLHSDRI